MAWMKQDIIKYYLSNEFAYRLWGPNMHFGYWEKGIKTQRQASLRFNQEVAKTVGIRAGDRVLDAGCGVGGCSIYLAKTFGCRVTGITITPRQVKLAQTRAAKEGVSHLTEFYEMDYENTEFADHQFDVVWGLESICYAKSKKDFIKEAFRVLKDDGKIVVADGFASKENYYGEEQRLMQRWLDGWRVNFLNTPSQFKEFAQQTGFNKSYYRNVTENVFHSSRLIFFISLPFLPLHLLDRYLAFKSYPTDACYHQYLAMKKRLWEYGIFHAEKK